MERGNLSWLDPYDLNRARMPRNAQIRQAHVANMNGIGHTWERCLGQFHQQLTVPRYQIAIFIDGLNLERAQVVQYNQVRDKSWRNRSTIREMKILSCIIRCQANSFDRLQTKLY